MLLEYIQAALRHAKYEMIQQETRFYGEITDCRGVYAEADNLEACRRELQEVLEEWILFRVHRNLPLPEIEGHRLQIKEMA